LQFAKTNFLKQVFNITDGSVVDAQQSLLMLESGEKYCCILVVKRKDFEAQKLVYYERERDDEPLLENVLTAHDEINRLFSDVLIRYSFPQSAMMPSKYYNLEDGKKILQVIYGNNQDVSVLSEYLPDWHAYNVYEVPKSAHTWINRQFHSGKYWHTYSASLKDFSSGADEDVLIIDFKTGQFNVILIKSRQLQLTQTFSYAEPADVLYYLLKICREFSVSQKEVKLILSGLIEKESALYRQLYQYFIFISFMGVPGFVKLPSLFREYPSHFFSSLFNLATCVS
jgi:uncharacterized protein DUF3822